MIVTDDHLLHMRCNAMPSKGTTGKTKKPWMVRWIVPDDAGKLKFEYEYFAVEADADAFQAQKESEQQEADPLQWEGTVREFRGLRPQFQRILMLYKAGAVTYPPPAVTLADVVSDVMVNAAGESIIAVGREADFVTETGWMLGIWLADGWADSAVISQGGPMAPEDGSENGHHEAAMDRMMEWGKLIGVYVEPVPHSISTSGNIVYRFLVGKRFEAILNEYELINHKHIPESLLTADVEVRMHLLAGILDGDGHLKTDSYACYELAAKDYDFAVQVKRLAMSLGFRVGKIGATKTTVTDGATGQSFYGHRLHISGNNIDALADYIRIGYKKPPPPNPNKSSDCWAIKKVTSAGTATSHGFTLDGGKQQVLMAGFTVMQVA